MAFVVLPPPHTSSCLNILFLKTRSRVVFGHRISVMTTRAMLLMTLITMIMTMMTTVVYEGGVKVSAASSCIGATLNSTIVCCSDVLHVFILVLETSITLCSVVSEWVYHQFFFYLSQPHSTSHFDTGTLGLGTLRKAAQCDDVLTAINANQDDRSGLPGLEVTEIIWQKCNAGMKNWRWLIQRRMLSLSMSKPTIFSQPKPKMLSLRWKLTTLTTQQYCCETGR